VTDYAAPIYIIKVPGYYTTEAPNHTTENTAPAYYTEAHKYYSAPIYTTTTEAAKYYVAQTYNADPSEKNKINTTPRLQFTTPQPTLHLDTMTKPPTTTPKMPNITQPRTVPQFNTLSNLSITLLQTNQTETPVYYTKANEYYTTTKR
jgi:hypothetical protein